MMDALRKLDAFPKALDDFRVRTKSGAFVSMLALTLMAFLFVSELRYYLRTELRDHLHVYTEDKPSTLRVGFDITFPVIACKLLSIDVVDDMGLTQALTYSEVYKHKIDRDGAQVGEAQPHELGNTIRTEEEIQALAKLPSAPTDQNPCGNCYGAASEGICCNTCASVREAYESKGWRFKPQDVLQCRREAVIENIRDKNQAEGGCQIYGTLHLSKASGHFHIAPHASIHESSDQEFSLFDFLSLTYSQFNITHTINSLSFGENFPAFKSPLDGQSRSVQDTHGMYQYYIKVVPTSYLKYGETKEIESNQYAVTEHMRHVSPGTGRGLPGVYFYYELSPVLAVFEETRGTFLRFLTSVCAILGGLFTVMGLVDKLLILASAYFQKEVL
jgi:hypothetical protein